MAVSLFNVVVVVVVIVVVHAVVVVVVVFVVHELTNDPGKDCSNASNVIIDGVSETSFCECTKLRFNGGCGARGDGTCCSYAMIATLRVLQ